MINCDRCGTHCIIKDMGSLTRDISWIEVVCPNRSWLRTNHYKQRLYTVDFDEWDTNPSILFKRDSCLYTHTGMPLTMYHPRTLSVSGYAVK